MLDGLRISQLFSQNPVEEHSNSLGLRPCSGERVCLGIPNKEMDRSKRCWYGCQMRLLEFNRRILLSIKRAGHGQVVLLACEHVGDVGILKRQTAPHPAATDEMYHGSVCQSLLMSIVVDPPSCLAVFCSCGCCCHCRWLMMWCTARACPHAVSTQPRGCWRLAAPDVVVKDGMERH